jgi:predicted nucleic acid-binding protein
MRYVLDSGVAFKCLVPEADSDRATRLRDGYLAGTHELFAPDVFPTELTHALTRAERQGRVTPIQGAQLFRDMLTTLPVLHPSLPLLPRAYVLSSLYRQGVYDCLYIALAEREGCELVTADDRLVKKLSGHFPFLTPLDTLA